MWGLPSKYTRMGVFRKCAAVSSSVLPPYINTSFILDADTYSDTDRGKDLMTVITSSCFFLFKYHIREEYCTLLWCQTSGRCFTIWSRTSSWCCSVHHRAYEIHLKKQLPSIFHYWTSSKRSLSASALDRLNCKIPPSFHWIRTEQLPLFPLPHVINK